MRFLYVCDGCHLSSEDVRLLGLIDLLHHLILGGENHWQLCPKEL